MLLIKTNHAFGRVVNPMGAAALATKRRFVTPGASGGRRSVMHHDL